MRSRGWRIVQAVLGIATVLFVAVYVIRNWDDVRQADMAWRISPVFLLAGVVLVWLVFAVQAGAWRRMVAAWGHRLEWFPAASVWLLSSMAKYIPGKVWALTSMAVMAERRGVPAWAATSSAVLLQILSVGTGALVVAATGLGVSQPAPLGRAALVILAAGSLSVTLLVLWPPVTRRLVARVAPRADPAHIPGLAAVGFGAGANLLAWLGYGTAFWLFARGSLPEAPLGMSESIGAFAGSYVAGMIAPFAPGGLGVRESVLILMLQSRIGLGNAVALSAVARLVTTAAEVLATIPFLLYAKESPRG
jgi:uncharacterized membrane protein YbhN (UPF0104 family)